jgi:serine/threonine-protein kinase
MIADFGIALAVSNAGGARLTATGLSLGTPSYMSPEQATGERMIDARTDVYAIGVLTYEMLTGEPPHTGPTAQATIAKVLTEAPQPVRSLRRSVPMHVETAVHAALEKLAADRVASARELADALGGKAVLIRPFENTRPRDSLNVWKFATLALGVVAVAVVVWALTRQPTPAAPPQHQYPLGLPDSVALDASTFSRSFDLSPKGTQFAYVGENGLFVHAFKEGTSRRLAAEAATDPRFSPDGAWVAYISHGTLRKVRLVGGGAPETIVDSVARFAWGSKGTIVFTRSAPVVADLWRVGENGEKRERLVQRPDVHGYGSPSFLPDGESFLVPVVTDTVPNEIAVYRPSDGLHYLGVRGDHPQYLDGLLLFGDSAGTIMAAPFDASALRVGERHTPVLQGVMRKLSVVELSVSAVGTIAYLPSAVPRDLVEIDRAGRRQSLPAGADLFSNPRYSPDGRRVVVAVGRQAPSQDIWIFDIASPTRRQLTNNHRSQSPEWTRDGRRVAWTELQGALSMRVADLSKFGVYWRAADGSDSTTSLIPNAVGFAFSRAADVAVGLTADPGRGLTLSAVRLDSTNRRIPLMPVTPGSAPTARVSPDGRWLAYVAPQAGHTEVRVRALYGSGDYTPISEGEGSEPMWNPRGKELFYRVGSHLMAATLALDGTPRVVRREPLPFTIAKPLIGVWASYDVSPDGQRFLTASGASEPVIITGWLDDLREKLKTRP